MRRARALAPAIGGIATAVVAATASAQTSVTVYGVVDTGIEYVNRVGSAHHNVVRMPSATGTVPSRWGLRGSEHLGGGLKANFQLEGGFGPDTGALLNGGRLFGRQAWVGLAGPWGQITVGRQYTMSLWATADPDVLGPNIYGTSNLDANLANPRSDNSIAYRGKFGGLTLGGTYSFGRDTVNAGPSLAGQNCAGENPSDHRACQQWTTMVMYEGSNWGVSAAYDAMRGGPGAFAGLSSSGMRDTRMIFAGYAILARAKMGAGLLRRDNDASPTRRSDLWWAGVAYDITPAITLGTQLSWLDYRHSDNRSILFAVRVLYSFSKRTSVYATAAYIDNGGTLTNSVSAGGPGSTSPGGNQLGAMVGVKHIF
ncbi:Membrane protein [Cupriavidus taiwanensis]|uniref:Membrane protein n=1 Tax=Cupriavidus taiwanensis TaxID=164546 RepID=A0A375BH77_9BURK|nr:porin [Cupriavidus taiwanensis]SOY44403.1 Membrane protein [Cupriavidus taiwanensis]